MWIWIAKKFAKKDLTEVKIFLKVIRGYFFKHPVLHQKNVQNTHDWSLRTQAPHKNWVD